MKTRIRFAQDEERWPEQLVGPEAREVPARVKGAAEQGDHLEHEHDEAPEDERVHDPGRLLAAEELSLADSIDHHPLDARVEVIEARGRLSAEEEPESQRDQGGEHNQRQCPYDWEHDVAHGRLLPRFTSGGSRSAADRGGQLVDDVEQVGDDPVVRDVEDRGARVLIDGDDQL